MKNEYFINRSRKSQYSYCVIFLLSLCGNFLTGQSITISGQIYDKSTGRPLAQVQVYLKNRLLAKQQLSAENGYFTFAGATAGRIKIQFERLSYQTRVLDFDVTADTTLKIGLHPAPLPLQEVGLNVEKNVRMQVMQNASQPVMQFDLKQIKEITATDPADVLSFAPGIFIKNYGGISGLKTVSLRGSGANQVKILLNGIEFDNIQTGVTDLSTLDLSAFETITLYRGGNAARFGANALAGVIDLRTFSADRRPFIQVSRTAGSFDLRSQKLQAGAQLQGWQIVTAISQRKAGGEYPFEFQTFGRDTTLVRTNADFENFHFLGAMQKHSLRTTAAVNFTHYKGNRGVPGAVLQGNFVESQARQKDTDSQLTGKFTWRITPTRIWRTAFRWHRSYLEYRDPQVRFQPQGIDNFYRSHGLYAQSAVEIVQGARRMVSKLEIGENRLRSNNLAQPLANSFAIIESVKRRFLLASLLWEKSDEHDNRFKKWQIGLRYSHFSDAGSAISPGLGFNLKTANLPVHWRLHLAHNFRVPAFSEQYFLNYGNHRLKPEKSLSFESGANSRFKLFGDGLFDVSLFTLHITDQIISIPRSPAIWSAENIGKTRHFGMEILTEWSAPKDNFRLRMTYTRQSAQDRTPGSQTFGKTLIYIPGEIFTAVFAIDQPVHARLRAQFSATARRASYRFHLPENDFESLLPGYTIFALKAGLKQSFGKVNFAIDMQIENIADTQYAIIHNYPMPGRVWRLKLKLGAGADEN